MFQNQLEEMTMGIMQSVKGLDPSNIIKLKSNIDIQTDAIIVQVEESKKQTIIQERIAIALERLLRVLSDKE